MLLLLQHGPKFVFCKTQDCQVCFSKGQTNCKQVLPFCKRGEMPPFSCFAKSSSCAVKSGDQSQALRAVCKQSRSTNIFDPIALWEDATLALIYGASVCSDDISC